MKFCKYCGTQLDDDVEVCSNCGRNIAKKAASLNTSETAETAKPSEVSETDETVKHIDTSNPAESEKLIDTISKKIGSKAFSRFIVILIVILIAAPFIATVAANLKTCKVSGCSNKPISGSDYCNTHTCSYSGCYNRCANDSSYCSYHQSLYSAAWAEYRASQSLEISNVRVSTEYHYTTAKGTITNNGQNTFKFVRIKGTFEDFSGNVLDTDWTYAVGAEGLAPGESSTWTMSVDGNSSIRSCTATIIDYDY